MIETFQGNRYRFSASLSDIQMALSDKLGVWDENITFRNSSGGKPYNWALNISIWSDITGMENEADRDHITNIKKYQEFS